MNHLSHYPCQLDHFSRCYVKGYVRVIGAEIQRILSKEKYC